MLARSLKYACRVAVTRASLSGRQLALVTTALLALAPLSVLGHGGELELSVSPSNIAAGDEVTVSGEGFAANAPLEMHLTGPNGDAHFGDVTVDEEGAFTQAVRIPGDVIPGVYLVRAEGADREASTELTVGAMAGMGPATQRATPERDRSNAWRTVALVLLLGLGIVGLMLARPVRPNVLARPSA